MSLSLTRGAHPSSIPVAHYGNSFRLVMSMGNYLWVRVLPVSVMAASNQRVGFDHVTVVPENFEPDDGLQDEDQDRERTDRA